LDIAFYHATRATVEAVLPRLLERALEAGLRVAVRGGDAVALDRHLWAYDPASFLPHALDTDTDAARQPVLLTEAATPANAATMLIALAPPLPRTGFTRAALVFADPDAAPARAEWKALNAEGLAVTYWKQGDKGWEKAG